MSRQIFAATSDRDNPTYRFVRVLVSTGTKYAMTASNGLLALMMAAKSDDDEYNVREWFQKKDRFIVYGTKKSREL